MRCRLRGERITYSPRSCVRVRVYCSSDSVSFPIRTTNAPPPESCTVAASTSSRAITTSPSGLRNANRLDFVVAPNGVDDVHSLGHLPEHRVDAVEVPLGRVTDKELAAARVLARMRH